MKTSNKILLISGCALVALAIFQVGYGVRQLQKTKEVMRPIVEQIDATEIRVVRMVRENDNYIVDNTNWRGYNRIAFTYGSPTPEALRIEGDTLVITSNQRVVANLPTVTHVIEWNGEVRELGVEN